MNRRGFLKYSISALLYSIFLPEYVFAGKDHNMMHHETSHAGKTDIEHPIKNPPEYTDKKRCDYCGMDRNKFARTRHEFQNSKGRFYTCSIHCVAVLSMKLKEEPVDVKVAEYFHPENMLEAKKAVYVIGSALPGTMTKKSKIACASEEEAERIIGKYGGAPHNLEEALAEAKKEIQSH